MNTRTDRIDFGPPREQRWGAPLMLALLAHGLLVAALTWGVGWKHDSATVVMEAELWSQLPQQAAPRAVEPEPPPPTPAQQPKPPEPEPPAPAPEPTPGPTEAEIALQKQVEAQKAEELRQREAARKHEEERKRELAQREAERKKEAARLAEEKKQREAERQKKLAAARKAEEARRTAQIEAERKQNLDRMLGQAGATGSSSATGTAQRSSGPSASYAGKVVSRIRPNIVFTQTAPGNPRAEVEVRTLPDGTIIGRRLTVSSGNPAWDEAVLRAVDRTAKLPQDENGRVPSKLILDFRPQD